MSEKNQRRLIMLFCLRCNGDVTLHETEIAFQLRISEEEWRVTKTEFINRGFINKDNNIIHWDKRQFISDNSGLRVKKHREKKKETLLKRRCNVTVTPPDTDTDTEKKEDIQSSSSSMAEKSMTIGEEKFEFKPEEKNTAPPLQNFPNDYHAVQFHPRYTEVREYVISRLPSLSNKNSIEANRWLFEGAEPEADIFPNIDFCIEAAHGNVSSFKYFTPSITSALKLKKEKQEQHQRMREKYAKPD